MLKLKDSRLLRDQHNRLTLPPDICQRSDKLAELIDFVFPDILTQHQYPDFFVNRAIVAPTTQDAAEVNDLVSARLPSKLYHSADVLFQATPQQEQTVRPEDMYAVQLPDMPDHTLNLHVGMPCTLMKDMAGPGTIGILVTITQMSALTLMVKCVGGMPLYPAMPLFMDSVYLTSVPFTSPCSKEDNSQML